jgi:N-acetylmuramoyl-L-alanine amidase
VLKTHEKEVVLSVAKQLKKMIDNETHMRAFLVRERDYFVPLRRRIAIAREGGADVFVSLHADSSFGTVAKGASVYVLSPHGSSSEAAKWLAERENKADLVGGVSLEDKNSVLASVLLDVTQAVNQSSSEELGSTVLKQLGKVTDLHKKQIERAGFVVLKSPDIPSILVELEFLSNKEGEKKLRDLAHQRTLAEAVFLGLKTYFSTRTLPPAHLNLLAGHGAE